jgi:lysozyme
MSELSDILIKHEGLRLFPYKDTTGHTTIGVGRNLDDRGITEDEAAYLLNNDIADFGNQLSEKIYWFDSAPEKVKVVLVDMAFNMGVNGLLSFHNTLEHIKNGNYQLAAVDMLQSKWAQQVGTRATDLSQILKSV